MDTFVIVMKNIFKLHKCFIDHIVHSILRHLTQNQKQSSSNYKNYNLISKMINENICFRILQMTHLENSFLLTLIQRIYDFQKLFVFILNNIQRIISFFMKQKDFSPLKWKNKNQKNYQSSGSLFNPRMSASARLKNRSQKPQLKKQISLFTTETSAIFDDDTNLIERTESNPFFKEKLKVKLNKHQKILQQLDKKQQPKPPSNKNLSTTLKQMRKQQKQEVLQSFSKIIENSKSKSVKDLWFKIK